MHDKKLILVTGGAGFIGSHLCEALAAQGHRVISLDSYFTGSRDNHVAGVEYREGHTKEIERHVPETPDIVYHLGEYSRVAKSIEEPAVVWDLNMAGTFAVLEFCRKRKCKIVYAGSSTKFAAVRHDGIVGRDLSPYTWCKAANTELAVNYGAWYGVPYVVVYFYNVYGPRELAGAYGTVIEIFKQQFLCGEKLTVRSPGTQKRNYTHVEDTVAGIILAGERGEGDEYGIAAAESYSTTDVAKLFGGEIEMLPARATSRPWGAADTSRIEALGWKQKHTLEEYIRSVKEKASSK